MYLSMILNYRVIGTFFLGPIYFIWGKGIKINIFAYSITNNDSFFTRVIDYDCPHHSLQDHHTLYTMKIYPTYFYITIYAFSHIKKPLLVKCI